MDRDREHGGKPKPMSDRIPGEQGASLVGEDVPPDGEPTSALGGGVATRTGPAETRDENSEQKR